MIRRENGNIGNKTWEKFKGEERGKIQNSRSERLKQRSREEYIMRRIAK